MSEYNQESDFNKKSEIVNNKKQLILKVDQTSDFVYPNELYKYQIYCKNVSGDTIENVHIQVINPSTIAIDEDDNNLGIPIGDLNNGQSHLLYLSARCDTPGEFTVHFLCYGEESELNITQKTINCDYDSYNKETIHRIHIYNFSPYEDTYELLSRNYSPEVTQLVKKQKLPYGAKENPFKMSKEDISNNIAADESQSYLDQKETLYGNKYDTDEHTYQYLERENFNKDGYERYEGENLSIIFDNINKYSKFFKVTKIKTGTNKLLNDFKQYYPDGFLYRFGLMNSEIFHHVGVLPEYSYMNDYLFRWAAEGTSPLNLYPKRLDMNWGVNKWAGHGWNVWKTYTDRYKEQIIHNENYKPLFEFVRTFENLNTAKEYIKNEYTYDTSNEYYIHTTKGLEKIRKYKYIIKESYFDTGVFFVHIPVSKIPSNFYLLDTDEIEAIIEKTKPYGMKALIKYVIDTKFNINLGMRTFGKLCPVNKFNLDVKELSYSMTPYAYHNIIETVCEKDSNDNVTYKERKALRPIPSGTAYSHSTKLNVDPTLSYKQLEPKSKSNLGIDPTIEKSGYLCEEENSLTYFSQIQDLLYQGNFEAISFKIKNIATTKIKDSGSIDIDPISAVDYQLWIESLKKDDSHCHWWDVEIPNSPYPKNTYYITEMKKDPSLEKVGMVDFFEIPLTNYQLTQEGVEIGIGFQDITGKLHGISSEQKKEINSFLIKYATSINNNFKIKKQGVKDIIGLAFKFVHINANTLVIFFLKTNEGEEINYHYFHHIVVSKIKSLFCFTRNNKDITSIKKWSNLIKIGQKTNPLVIFNTPQYDNLVTYDPKLILEKDNTNWKNLTRIDKNEYSYAVIDNTTQEEMPVDDIKIHFDNTNIPDDAIIKAIKIKSILETNSYKTIYHSIRFQDGFIEKESSLNSVSLHPVQIECYPTSNNNTKYYEKQYKIAETNEIQKSIDLFKSKITENKIFNESLRYSTDYVDDIDDYITVKKPFWVELSSFTDYYTSMNNVSEIKFCIEGYNNGKEVYLSSQLRSDELFSESSDVRIQSGYFKKYIPLKFYNKFFLDDIQLRFRFKGLNSDINIFDTYLDVKFKEKQNEERYFEEDNYIDIEKKKNINIDLISEDTLGYILSNGFTVKLGFDDLEPGEYYRIYSIELNIIYQKQNIDFLVNSNPSEILSKNVITVVNGQITNNCMCGMFYNELIMPGTYQDRSTLNADNQGIELIDALFQSFVATSDNITSVTLFPNGFVGNPDVNLKIALYENKGNTPNKLLKEIRVGGWSKVNPQLKNASIVTYDFNVNNLTIGNKYWLKIEVENPSKENYYLLKYADSSVSNLKLLTRIDNNFINTFGSLKFYINTLNSFDSFNSLPVSEDKKDFSDPKIFISLNKRIGEIKKIKVLSIPR